MSRPVPRYQFFILRVRISQMCSGCGDSIELRNSDGGRLAQPVRAPALQAGGPRFEPASAHQLTIFLGLTILLLGTAATLDPLCNILRISSGTANT